MLKRGFYDLVTGVSFVLVIGISILISSMSSNTITEGAFNSAVNSLLILQLIIGAIVFIYWLFILILAINLYENGMVIILEVILSAVLIPFVPLVYLLLLRSPLKEYDENGANRIKKPSKNIGNVPGTP